MGRWIRRTWIRSDEPLGRRAEGTDEPLGRRAESTDEPLGRRADCLGRLGSRQCPRSATSFA
ncbi:hypothetical protein BST41_27270 [Mycolicibacterium porcinum]|nr:hypothetical protein BST41_27270 [Mycolicibacterium porcinum]